MIDLLRIMSLFGGGGQQQPGWQTPGFNPYEPTPTFSGMFNPRPQGQEAIVDNFNQPNNIPSLAELYKPNMEMQERFRQLLAQFPQRTEPSGWRKFGAVLTGLGGENAGEAMQLSNTAANLPYMMKLQDWQHQAGPVLKAVDDERAYNQQNLGMANQQLSRMLDERRVSETERRNRETADAAARKQTETERANLSKEQLAARRAEVQEGYLSLAELKANNSHTFKTREDGMIMAINNMDPTRVQETGIKSTELSDARKIALGLERDLEVQGARHRDRITEITTPRPPTTHTTTTTGGAGGLNPTQERVRVENRKRQMMLDRPDLYNYIDQATGTHKRGTPENIKQEINQYIYGETRPTSGSSVTPVASGVPFNKPGERPSAPNAPRVRAADGFVMVWDNETKSYGYMPRANVIKAKGRFEVVPEVR